MKLINLFWIKNGNHNIMWQGNRWLERNPKLDKLQKVIFIFVILMMKGTAGKCSILEYAFECKAHVRESTFEMSKCI